VEVVVQSVRQKVEVVLEVSTYKYLYLPPNLHESIYFKVLYLNTITYICYRTGLSRSTSPAAFYSETTSLLRTIFQSWNMFNSIESKVCRTFAIPHFKNFP